MSRPTPQNRRMQAAQRGLSEGEQMHNPFKRLVFMAAAAALCLAPRGVALAQLSPGWVNAVQADYRQRQTAFRHRYYSPAYSGGTSQWQSPQGGATGALSTPVPARRVQSWQGGLARDRAAAWQNERRWQAHPHWQSMPQWQRQPLGGWVNPPPRWQPRPSWQAGWPQQQSWQPEPGPWGAEGALQEESLGQTVGSLIDGVVNGAQ